MGSITKKLITLLLLAVMLAPLTYNFFFQANQQHIQHRMKKQLEENRLHHLVLSKHDLHWVKPGREILVEDKMFDIKTIEYRENNTVFITGLFDHEETLLVRQMQKDFEKENSRNNRQLVQFFQLLQALPDAQPDQYQIPELLLSHRYFFNPTLLPSPYKLILTPPPQS